MEWFRNISIRARVIGIVMITLGLPVSVEIATALLGIHVSVQASVLVGLFVFLLGGLMAAVLAWSITRPLRRIRQRVVAFVKKRQPITIDDPGSDEFTELAMELDKVFGVWKHELAKIQRSQQETVEEIEHGRAASAELERQLAMTRSCLQVARKLSTTFDFQANLKTILDEAVRAMNVQWASILLINRENLEMKVACVRGIEQSLLEDLAEDQYPSIKLKPNEGIAGQVIKEGLPLIANKGFQDRRFKVYSELRAREEKTASILCAPILGEDGKTLGVMNFTNRINPPVFRNEDIPFAQDLCILAALVIERNRVYHNLFRDDATGLLSYKVWRGHLDEEAGRAVRYAQPLSLMIVDIDRFQGFAEQAGPEFALEVGNRIGRVIQSQLRDVDLATRSKDRYFVLLPHTDTAGAVFLAGRTKEAIEALTIDHDRRLWRFQASVGIANYPDTGSDATKLLDQALSALHEAKTAGRNRAVIHGRPVDGDTPTPTPPGAAAGSTTSTTTVAGGEPTKE